MSKEGIFGKSTQEKDFHRTPGRNLPASFFPSLSGLVYSVDRFREYSPFLALPLYHSIGFFYFFIGFWRASLSLNGNQRQGYSFQSETQRFNSKSTFPFNDLDGTINRGL